MTVKAGVAAEDAFGNNNNNKREKERETGRQTDSRTDREEEVNILSCPVMSEALSAVSQGFIHKRLNGKYC